jgi:hypothetical protein
MHSLVSEVGVIGRRAVCKRQIVMNYIKLMAFKLEMEILNFKRLLS